MATEHGHNADEPRNVEVSYDKTDLGARGILIFFIVLAIFAVGVHLVVLGLYAGMMKITDRHQPDVSPLVPQRATPQPSILANTADVNVQHFPEPRLQNDDTADMTRFLQTEDQVLAASDIDSAMQSTIAKLPVRAGGTAPPQSPGAHRVYSYPTAPDAAAIESSEKTQGNNPPEMK